jgi:hypothetical protein
MSTKPRANVKHRTITVTLTLAEAKALDEAAGQAMSDPGWFEDWYGKRGRKSCERAQAKLEEAIRDAGGFEHKGDE